MVRPQVDALPLVSIVMPVYNEAATIRQVIDDLRTKLSHVPLDIVIVDDGSTDGSQQEVQTLGELAGVRCFFHAINQGKGAAIKTALQHVQGELVVIQDADLEYDPNDILRLIRPILDGRADVVYGTRFRGEVQRVHLFWHRVANAVLTLASNMLTNLNLSDMETGYKAFRVDVLRGISLRERRFGVEPELTAKIAKKKCRVYEVPISYHGRNYEEGKKVGFRDAFWAFWCILRYRFGD